MVVVLQFRSQLMAADGPVGKNRDMCVILICSSMCEFLCWSLTMLCSLLIVDLSGVSSKELVL